MKALPGGDKPCRNLSPNDRMDSTFDIRIFKRLSLFRVLARVARVKCVGCCAGSRRTGGRQDAFTLIELIVTIVIIGIVLLALGMSFHESLKVMGRQSELRALVVLSAELINEVRSKRYVDPGLTNSFGPEAGEVRRTYDDVDDYDDWSETPPETAAGNVMSNFSGVTRRVVVVNVPAHDFNAAPVPDNSTDFKRITVVVSNALIAVSNMSVVSRYE